MDYHVIVMPEKRLVYSITDEFDETKYYDYKTDEEISLFKKSSSYSTEASVAESISFAGPRNTGIVPPKNAFKYINTQGERYRYVFLVPMSAFIKNRFDNSEGMSPKTLSVLLHIMPTNKATELSFDPEVAKEQLESLVYGRNTNIKAEKNRKR